MMIRGVPLGPGSPARSDNSGRGEGWGTSCDPGKAMQRPRDERVLPHVLDVPEEHWREHDVHGSVPDHLVGQTDLALPRRSACVADQPRWEIYADRAPDASVGDEPDPGHGRGIRRRWLLGKGGRSRRREVDEQVRRVHLEEIHRLGQAVESPGAKAAQADPVWDRLADRRAHSR